jgi:hypothetical protein
MRRILEITEELDLPVFIPLNGFQWWYELPEFYNWWDPDGTKTPAAFFQRQDNPQDFKRRFIAGYNPDNKWNVDWVNFETPMKLNRRNWGGGEFVLAPPPNLAVHTRAGLTYRQVVEDRYQAIISSLVKVLERWQKTDKMYLFAGITIGTEVSLNASVGPDDFSPYGFRAVQDWVCPESEPICGSTQLANQKQLQQARQDVVAEYLETMSKLAVLEGLPKQRIYTHIWGEAEIGQAAYAPYHQAAINSYSRPGISLYGYATDPLSLFPWQQTLKKAGFPEWGGVEFSADKTTSAWNKVVEVTLSTVTHPVKVIDLYNWGEHKNTPVIPVLAQALTQSPPARECEIAEILPQGPVYQYDPERIRWNLLTTYPTSDRATRQDFVLIPFDQYQFQASSSAEHIMLTTDTSDYDVSSLEPGSYSWQVERSGCPDKLLRTSTPYVFYQPFPAVVFSTQERILLTIDQWLKKNMGLTLFR